MEVTSKSMQAPALFSVREAMREAGIPGWGEGSGVSSADAIRTLAAARDAAQAEAAKFKARCYPNSNDVFERGVTREQCEAWLLSKGAAFTSDINRRTKRAFYSWDLPDVDGWSPVTWEPIDAEISGLIEWAADALKLPQWDVLEEMAAMEVGDDDHRLSQDCRNLGDCRRAYSGPMPGCEGVCLNRPAELAHLRATGPQS